MVRHPKQGLKSSAVLNLTVLFSAVTLVNSQLYGSTALSSPLNLDFSPLVVRSHEDNRNESTGSYNREGEFFSVVATLKAVG